MFALSYQKVNLGHNLEIFLTFLMFSNHISSQAKNTTAITMRKAIEYNFQMLQRKPWRRNAKESPENLKKAVLMNGASQ